MKTIGILGGLGPSTTAYLNNRLVKISQKGYGAVEDYDFNPMIFYEVPIKTFDEYGIEDKKAFLSALKKGVKTLEMDGSDFIIIDCNTAHYFIDDLRKSVKVPILSIIEEVLKYCENKKYNTLGVTGTQSTVETCIYDKVFSKHKRTIIHPTKEDEDKAVQMILNVMGGKNNNNDIKTMKSISNNFKKKGADAMILGCTELSNIVEGNKFSLPVIDTTDIIAKAALKYAYS